MSSPHPLWKDSSRALFGCVRGLQRGLCREPGVAPLHLSLESFKRCVQKDGIKHESSRIHERIHHLRLRKRRSENWLQRRIKNNWMRRIWREFAFRFLCNSLWCDSKLQQHPAPACTEIVGSLLVPKLHQAWGDNAFLVFLLQVDTEG